MNFRTRLLVLVAVATLVPAILMGLRFFQNRTSEIETALVNLTTTANNISNELDEKIQGTAQMQYGLSRARDLDTRNRGVCSAFLSAVREEYPQYTGILTIDPDGRLFCDSLQTDRNLDLNDRAYFQKVLTLNGVVALEPAFGRLTGISVLQIAYPARSETAQLKFVLLASFNLKAFAEDHSQQLSGSMEVLLVDKKGTVLAWPPGPGQAVAAGASIADTDLFRFAASRSDRRTGEVTGLDGSAQVWAVASPPAIRDAGLYVMVGMPKDKLVAAANRRLLEDMAILAAVSLLLFAGVWTLGEVGIRRQVRRLTVMATKLGHGDLSVRIPPPHPGGELGGLMTVLNGAAESLERQHAAIDDLNRKLHQSQKMESLGQLTGGLAHDFNNLLTVILGNAEHLAEELVEKPELRSLAEDTVSAAERGAELTRSLLAFSRKQPLMPKDIDVGQQLLRMEVLLRRTLGAQIGCKFMLAQDLWPAVVDPAQLESAVLNLVLNARDATPSGGSVTVEVRNASLDAGYAENNDEVLPGDYVMISVTDTGSGMSREVAARAFEPFFTTKEVGKGSGLGLSMVYGFVKQSGGSMKIYSEVGHGTAIKLYLPRAGVLRVADDATRDRGATRGGNEVVLVVEDDDMVRAHVERELKGLGYRVILAGDGLAALEILRQPVEIDLLFTDVVMPGGMLGPQLVEKALQLRPGLKVLYTSGYSENAVIHNGRLDPGVQLLNKPFRRHDLAEMLHSILTAQKH